MGVKHFRELRVYQEAFDAAMRIYECAKTWPKEVPHAPTHSHTHALRRDGQNPDDLQGNNDVIRFTK